LIRAHHRASDIAATAMGEALRSLLAGGRHGHALVCGNPGSTPRT